METTPLGYVYGTLLTLAGLGLTALLGWGAVFLAAKAKQSKLAALALELYELAQSIVVHVEVNMRADLRAALKDGALNEIEKVALKREAMRLFKEALAEHGLKKLEKLKGLAGPAVEVYLSGLLERALGVQRAVAPRRIALREGDTIATRVVTRNPELPLP